MKARLTYLLLKVRESFWFLPTVMMLAAVALSHAALHADRATAIGAVTQRLWFGTLDEESSRLILSTVTGAMITTASLVFSLTLVSLTLASQQLGPRLLSLFLRDRMTQVVLGLFLATFVYALIVLMALGAEDGPVLVPMLSITVAVVFTISSFVALIMFIHHLSTSLQADVVVSRVTAQLKAQIDQHFNEQASSNQVDRRTDAVPCIRGRSIETPGCGYIQAIDHEALMALAEEHDLQLRILRGPGDFVCEGESIAVVNPASADPDAFRTRLHQSIVFGEKRTATQDLEFGVMAIVEIALRALSPGINDPHSAKTCIDRLGEILVVTFGRVLPSPVLRDAAGDLRVVRQAITIDRLLDIAFDEIRQHASSSISVMLRLGDALQRLAARADTAEQTAAVHRHGKMLQRCVEAHVDEPAAREELERILARVFDALDGARGG